MSLLVVYINVYVYTVLTSRVAWLILSENVPPQNIVVVTFTNKAAKEMRHRLESPELLGPSASDKLCMGTFHSICARLLRQYHGHVNLKDNFTIADTDARWVKYIYIYI